MGVGQESAEAGRLGGGAGLEAAGGEGGEACVMPGLADPPPADAGPRRGAPPPSTVSFAPTAPDEFEELRAAMAAQGVRDARILDWGRELVVEGQPAERQRA
jgi:hypothetical protein